MALTSSGYVSHLTTVVAVCGLLAFAFAWLSAESDPIYLCTSQASCRLNRINTACCRADDGSVNPDVVGADLLSVCQTSCR